MNLCNILQAQILDEHKVVDLEILNLTNILCYIAHITYKTKITPLIYFGNYLIYSSEDL